jgi:phenylalanyl-tRNA synthetase beta subunit
MGGEDTKVSSTTRNVFLEAAHFAPSAIIGRSRKLGLHTDAGHRFERGVDPELPRIAVERATTWKRSTTLSSMPTCWRNGSSPMPAWRWPIR